MRVLVIADDEEIDQLEKQVDKSGIDLLLRFQPVASDLREGKATLAVIHAFDHGNARDRQTIQRVLDERCFENVSRQQIKDILARNSSVEYAMAVADRYAEQGRKALEPFPDSEFKRALLWVPDFVVARDK